MMVGVIGAGAWGTALGIAAARGGANVTLWSYDGLIKNFDSHPDMANISITSDMALMRDMDVWLVVTPGAFFRETIMRAREFYAGQAIIICTKGAEYSTGMLMSEILADVLPECKNFGVLSGPQFAAEVASGVPTGSTLAGNDIVWNAGRAVLNTLYLEHSTDIIGVEFCGVGKNAVALICGYNSIAAAGENERAMIFTRAWNEVVNMGLAAGAKLETFLALCGIGDLFLSATSQTSRNFSGGMAIASNRTPDGTVEGIAALHSLVARAEKLGVDVPVLKEMAEKMAQ